MILLASQRPWQLRALAALTLLASLCAPRVAAAEPRSSLDLVPADAHVYMAHLHKRELFERIAASRWWARLKALPATQLAWQGFQQSWQAPRGVGDNFRKFLANPDNQILTQVAFDLVSDEVFFYGDEKLADLVELYFLFGNSANLTSFLIPIAQSSGADGATISRLNERLLLEPVLKNTEKIAVPRLVVGFKARDVAATERQLQRLVTLLRDSLSADVPDFAERLEQSKIAERNFWTLKLDGDMIPWDSLPLAEIGNEDAYRKFADHCRKLKLTLAVGVAHGYLLLSVGPSTDHLATLGQGPLLASRPEMAPIHKLTGRKLTDIDFVSGRFRAASQFTGRDARQLIAQAKEIVHLGFTEFLARKAAADLDDLAKDLEQLIPKPGAVASASYLSDRGYETWQYDYSPQTSYDGSAPLAVLHHVGGQPLLLFAERSQPSPLGYALLVKWLKRSRFYLDTFASANMTPEQQANYRRLADKAAPLLQRLETITSTMFVPALRHGESALVVEARLGSKQWHPLLLPADQELKLPLPAVVHGVKDATLLQKALGEYRTLVNDTITALREVTGAEVPDVKLPPANSKPAGGGTIYWYPLPPIAGVDARLAPNCGVSEKTFVVSLAPQQSQNCLESKTPQLGGLLVEAQSRPACELIYVDLAGLADVAKPWVVWALRSYVLSSQGPDEAKLALETVHGAAELLRAIRSYSSVTTLQGNAIITHSLWHIEDLPAK